MGIYFRIFILFAVVAKAAENEFLSVRSGDSSITVFGETDSYDDVIVKKEHSIENERVNKKIEKEYQETMIEVITEVEVEEREETFGVNRVSCEGNCISGAQGYELYGDEEDYSYESEVIFMPEMPMIPEIPDIPDIPEIPEIPKIPDIPDITYFLKFQDDDQEKVASSNVGLTNNELNTTKEDIDETFDENKEEKSDTNVFTENEENNQEVNNTETEKQIPNNEPKDFMESPSTFKPPLRNQLNLINPLPPIAEDSSSLDEETSENASTLENEFKQNKDLLDSRSTNNTTPLSNEAINDFDSLNNETDEISETLASRDKDSLNSSSIMDSYSLDNNGNTSSASDLDADYNEDFFDSSTDNEEESEIPSKLSNLKPEKTAEIIKNCNASPVNISCTPLSCSLSDINGPATIPLSSANGKPLKFSVSCTTEGCSLIPSPS